MTQSNGVHPAAKAMSYELDNWERYPIDCRWKFSAKDGRLIAEYLDYDGGIIAAYSVDLAEIPFTKHPTA